MSEENDNVVELGKLFAIDNRARGFFTSLKTAAAVIDALGGVISLLDKSEQRFLCQILAWRIEGAPYLPATEGLVHMPLLVGMGFEEIQRVADTLNDKGIVRTIILKSDSRGNPLEMAFAWPQLEMLLQQATPTQAAIAQALAPHGQPT
jgi:hypothetical protein